MLNSGSGSTSSFDDLIVVDLKSVQPVEEVHHLQLLTSLRLSGRWLGLLFNFNVPVLKHGIHRHLNGYARTLEPAPS